MLLGRVMLLIGHIGHGRNLCHFVGVEVGLGTMVTALIRFSGLGVPLTVVVAGVMGIGRNTSVAGERIGQSILTIVRTALDIRSVR